MSDNNSNNSWVFGTQVFTVDDSAGDSSHNHILSPHATATTINIQEGPTTIIESNKYSGPPLLSITKCNVCKKEKELGDIALAYGHLKIPRAICWPCYVKKLDRQFGLKIADTEELLYK